MQNLLKIIDSPASYLVATLLVLLAYKEGYDMWSWIKTQLENYRKKKNHDEDTQNRINALEQNNSSQDEVLCNIENTLKAFKLQMDRMEKDRKADIVNSSRATIYLLAEQFKEKGYLTTAEYEAFDGISSTYLNNNGNSVYKHKIIPEILSLPVHD